MSTVEFHPWNSRRADTEKPGRVADRPRPDARLPVRPGPRVSPMSRTRCSTSSAPSAGRRRPAARACTSTCGSSRRTGFADVRRAALAFAREVERRAPDDVTTTWWRKDRDPAKLFVDYNQNARDHTIASRLLGARRARRRRCRPRSPGTRSTTSSRPSCTIATVPARASPRSATFTPASTTPCSRIDELLEWAERDEHEGAADPGEPDDDPA